MDLKRPLTFSEQVEKLKEHSIIITDDEQKDAEEYLSHVNYYKLTGYTLQFRKDAESSDLATPHAFSEIKNCTISMSRCDKCFADIWKS